MSAARVIQSLEHFRDTAALPFTESEDVLVNAAMTRYKAGQSFAFNLAIEILRDEMPETFGRNPEPVMHGINHG
jgi:hypothetical protein